MQQNDRVAFPFVDIVLIETVAAVKVRLERPGSVEGLVRGNAIEDGPVGGEGGNGVRRGDHGARYLFREPSTFETVLARTSERS